ncbi:type II toxin-antitoxin system VapC family toxin [soil metagenome]
MGSAPLTGSRDRTPDPPHEYLLDTHIWLWYVVGSDRLPATLRTTIDASIGHLWISPISVWELGMLHTRGRIELKEGPRRWLDSALSRFPLKEASLTTEVALRSHEVDLGHRDPADHLLAATALVHGLTLVTLDARLAAASWLSTVSD